jgi:hypothetical protein
MISVLTHAFRNLPFHARSHPRRLAHLLHQQLLAQDTPPRYFYRVFDDKSVSRSDEEKGGFHALPDENGIPFTDSVHPPKSLKVMVEQHLNWGNRNPTPFISVTSMGMAIRYFGQRRGWLRNPSRLT